MPVRLCFCTSVELRIGLEQDILSQTQFGYIIYRLMKKFGIENG